MRTDVETDNWLSRWKVRRLEKKKARTQAETFGLLVKENLEAFIFAVVLVVIVRHFALTPFRIPSSSMAPTLLGDKNHNDRLFVNRWIYNLQPIRRWDVVVFLYPLNQDSHFIKRLVGLPGERIAIADGDIYINGRISRKSARAQRSLWLKVNRIGSRAEFLAWERQRKSTTYDEIARAVVIRAAASKPAVFRFGRSPEIRDGLQEGTGVGPTTFDVYEYFREGTPDPIRNRRSGNGNLVGDVRISCRITPKPGTRRVAAEIVSGNQIYRVVLPVDDPSGGSFTHHVETSFGGDARQQQDRELQGFSLQGGQQHELAFWHLDRRIGLELDGRRWIYDEQDIALGEVRVRTNKAEVAIEVDQGEVRLEQVALDRDVYYTNTGILDRASRGQDFEIPADHYFVLGDNSPSSSDSRAWAVARVTLKNGRVINRELNPNDRPWTALSRDDGKHVLYRDEFGVVHKVKRSDIQSREIFGEPQASSRADDPDNNMMEYAGVDPRYQTVRRELILGRAFFIFWPHWRVSFIK